ncbi:MAG: dephospho-CoA kinase [Bdellovibrionota bacterium]
MKWIGLTGGMGTGKSTVSMIIQTLGYNVLNADKSAHEALKKTSSIFPEILRIFSDKILGPDGEIDRRKLGSIVFADKFMLEKLEAITHPFIQDQTQKEREALAAKGVEMAFYDIPLLFEKKLQKRFDKIVVVTCGKETQIQRAMERTKLSREEIRQRLANQMAMETKAKMANYVIRNDGSMEELKMKVQDLILQLKQDLKLV